MKKILILVFAAALAVQAAGDKSFAVQSAVVPGLGQIAAGSGNIKSRNTLKGLGIMCAFALSAHGMLSEISLKESYAEQTKLYSEQEKQIKLDKSYSDLVAVQASHKQAYDNYESANTMSYVFLGLTVGIYAYGIVDAMLFTTADGKGDEGAQAPARRVQFGLLRTPAKQTGLAVRCQF